MKRITCLVAVVLFASVALFAQTDNKRKSGHKQKGAEYLGKLSANPFDPDSISNPFGTYGNPYSPKSVKTPYSRPGFKANNPYSFGGPKIIGKGGKYLGRLNQNKYDPQSIANPYGVYGSKYSPNSVKNPYGTYGSRYSPFSATNPYTTQAPKLYSTDSLQLDNLGGVDDLGTGNPLDLGLGDLSDP